MNALRRRNAIGAAKGYEEKANGVALIAAGVDCHIWGNFVWSPELGYKIGGTFRSDVNFGNSTTHIANLDGIQFLSNFGWRFGGS